MNLCRRNNRRYFCVSFCGSSYDMRMSYIKLIPSVKIRKARFFLGYYQMMIGCNGDYCDMLLYELNKAKRNDGWAEFCEVV